LFGIIELVKNRETMEPLTPFNTLNDTMQQLGRSLIDNGLSTFIRWWNVMTNPPLCITEEQLAEGFEIIDRSLAIADAAMED
jgi:taurine--2-oxoglutarate transaminase